MRDAAGRRRRAVAGVVAIVLDLDGRPSRSVDLDMNCGLAWPDVDVKGGDLTVPVDAFAELYRAQGGHLDPPRVW